MLASLQRCQAQKLDAGGVIYVPPRVTRRERRTVEMQHTYAAKTIQAALRRRNHRNEVNASNNPYGLIRGMRRASDQEYISSSPLRHVPPAQDPRRYRVRLQLRRRLRHR